MRERARARGGGGASAAFEPVIDYVVVKWPRFAFEKFPGADTTLGTQMKSVGEAMSIGRTFCEALQKAARSLETGKDGLVSLFGRVDYRALAEPKQKRDLSMEAPEVETPKTLPPATDDETRRALEKLVATPTADRLFYVADAMRAGLHRRRALRAHGHRSLVSGAHSPASSRTEEQLARGETGPDQLRAAKRLGFSDRADRRRSPAAARTTCARCDCRRALRAVYARVDTCAAEFVAHDAVPLLDLRDRERGAARPDAAQGGHPRRRSRTGSGRGSSSTTAASTPCMALREAGFETVMVNCNPETVSTDYDTSDRLYFEPLTLEDVLDIVDEEKPEGVIVQFGGQTPLKLAVPLEKRGVHLLGTSADAIDRAEDRGRFDELLTKLALKRPRSGIAHVARRGDRRSPSASASRCSCARATCSAGAR